MKKIMKRLLGIMLVIAMVLGMVPVSGMTVQAADNQVIYLDLSGLPESNRTGWSKPGVHALNSSGGIVNNNFSMTKVNDTLYTATISEYATKVIFTPQTTWDKGETDQVTIADAGANKVSTYPMYKVTSYQTGSDQCWKGSWSTYTHEDSSVTTKRIYFDTTAYGNGSGWGEAYAYISNENDTTSGTLVKMTSSGTKGIFYYDVPTTFKYIIFRPNADNWSGQTEQTVIPGDKNLFTCTAFGNTTSGSWSTYQDGSSTTTTGTFYVQADLMDYYNDNRVGKDDLGDNRYNNQGNEHYVMSPYSKLNTWISNLEGYAFSSNSTSEDVTTKKYIYYKNTNNWSTVYAHYWNGSGMTTTWPGSKMESLGNGVYAIDYPEDATMIQFNNGSNEQTADLEIGKENQIYNNGSWLDYSAADSYKIYYSNPNGWNSVKAYYWSDDNQQMSTWPGDLMTKCVDVTVIGMDMYEITIPADATYVIFSNADNSKDATGNIILQGTNKIYNGTSWIDYGINADDASNKEIPLYFGDLYHPYQLTGGGLVNSWYRGANVSFVESKKSDSDGDGTKGESISAVAQGIVGSNLNKDGQLVASWKDDANREVLIPFFEENAYDGQSNYMTFYKDLQFPFKSETTNGVTTYSFNSQSQTVYYDYDNKKILTNSNQIQDASEQVGYFPFNQTNPDTTDKEPDAADSVLNYGFGTKFTIPFTINQYGTKSGERYDSSSPDDAITFEFTGDDDVWVFIDGALVLDMGGAHNLASGTINFATQTATVTTGSANAKIDANKFGTNSEFVSNDKEEISFDQISVVLYNSDGTVKETTTLAEYIKDEDEVHTLTMYYMERGMWNSNMSISFTFRPVPSGLVVSKDVDTSNINEGLKSVVENVDEFSYSVDAKKDTSPVSFNKYTLTDHNNKSTSKETTNNTIEGVRADRFANTFLQGDTDAFEGGTDFVITEKISGTVFSYDESATIWKLYDAKNKYKKLKDSSVDSDAKDDSPTVAEFTLGQASTGTTSQSYSYSLNFINTMNVGALTLEKVFSGTQTSDESYDFILKLDLDGTGTKFAPQTYSSLVYTGVDSGGNAIKGTTDEKGQFSLHAGDKVTFSGIPTGVSYEIEEVGQSVENGWEFSGSSGEKGTISNTTSEAVFTNTGKATLKFEKDQIVIDYGKNVQVDVLANDGEAFKTADYISDASEKYTKNDSDYTYIATGTETDVTWTVETVGFLAYNDENSAKAGKILDEETINSVATSITTDNGTYSIADNKKVEFELKTMLSSVDKVFCVVKVKNNSNDTEKYYLNELDIIPATIMYYETDFADGVFTLTTTSTSELWHKDNITGDVSEDLMQNDGTIGLNQTYGYDSSYSDDKYLSNGSSYMVIGQGVKLNENTTSYTEAKFTFTGTGFDLISRTGANQGAIRVDIYTDEARTAGNRVKSVTVLNKSESNLELYQIPVVSVNDLEYNTYYVTIGVNAAYTNENYPDLNRGGEFYFDAIRIFDPINVKSGTNSTGDALCAYTAYLIDNEAQQQITEVRSILITNEDYDVTTTASGMAYVDRIVDTENNSHNVEISTYETIGPNNEVYLQNGQAIAFKVSVDTIPGSFDVGAKSANGTEANLKVKVSATNNLTDAITIDKQIQTSTALFYPSNAESKFTWNGDTEKYEAYVCITNTSTVANSILSITDIKIAYTDGEDVEVASYSVDEDVVSFAAFCLSEPEIEEANYDIISAELLNTKNKKNNTVLKVVTSQDVEYLAVKNKKGKEVKISTKYEINEDGNKEWTVTIKSSSSEKETYTVTGYGEDGTEGASASVSVTNKTTNKKGRR